MAENIYVGNLTFDTDSSQLERLFAEHGQVTRAQAVKPMAVRKKNESNRRSGPQAWPSVS